jgi:hypothetical protein
VEDLVLRYVAPLELRQLGWVCLVSAHEGPDHTSAVDCPIGRYPDLALEVRLGRLRRHVDTSALAVELPAVVNAAQTLVFVPPEEHGGAAVRAGFGYEPDFAAGIAEGNEILAQ